MKGAEYIKTLGGKSAQELKGELAALRKEQFSLRMQKAMGQLNKTSLVGDVRRNIARVKTVMQKGQK
jgi:large subunit ribosomal protein L29